MNQKKNTKKKSRLGYKTKEYIEILRQILPPHGFNLPKDTNGDNVHDRIIQQAHEAGIFGSVSSKSTRFGKETTNEEFYTNEDLAHKLCDQIRQMEWFLTIERIIEPSAGKGGFSKQFDECKAYDLDPQGPGIEKADFLKIEIQPGPKTLIIGNPPFGRAGSQAIDFLQKCEGFAHYIAFILPASFQKPSMQQRVPEHLHLIYQENIPPKSFHLPNNQLRDVNCVFQIWEKREQKREILPQKKESNYFTWTKKRHEADLAFRRCGATAGDIAVGEDIKEVAKYWNFIKLKPNVKLMNVIECFESIDWKTPASNTTKTRSLSRPEIAELFDKHFNKYQSV
jgi:hypothetical protein